MTNPPLVLLSKSLVAVASSRSELSSILRLEATATGLHEQESGFLLVVLTRDSVDKLQNY